jgi:uncharacterized protein (DUF885 family)
MILANEYFDFLASRFPVMCAGDEFLFLPRVAAANRYYDRMESLDRESIEECIEILKEFQNKFDGLASRETELERTIDLELLKASAGAILFELEENRSWRHDPVFYLKIAFIGLDHSLTKPADDDKQMAQRVLARLHAIPKLLRQAAGNLAGVPKTYYIAAFRMISDCLQYLDEIGASSSIRSDNRFVSGLRDAGSAVEAFREALVALTPIPDEESVVPDIRTILKERFLSVRDLSEVLQVAVEEWRESLEHLDKLQRQINPDKSWKELYHDYLPADAEGIDTIDLYRRETERLASFFRTNGFPEIDLLKLPQISETPVYLQSVRSSASFSAAFSRDIREKDIFYITTRLPLTRTKKSEELLLRRLNREYKFLAAHETIPGHFLLDSTRRKLENPVRAQIESPLFYEGWAYYAETLLTETGYDDNPMDRLVDHKRRLWRAARCRIEIGSTTNRLGFNDAAELLINSGFSLEEAASQVNRFRLNPGYQLCYSLGRFEIMRLREMYGPRMGLERFHRFILEGGELPFHMIEKRLAALASTQQDG